MISFSLKSMEPTTVARRLFVAVAGLGPLFLTLYRAPDWAEVWKVGSVAAIMIGAAALLVVALVIAVRGSAGTVKRVALEIVGLGCALMAAEAALLARAPESWPEDPVVQRMLARERAASEHGLDYDPGRLRVDVIRDLKSAGVDAVPGFAQVVGADRAVSAQIRARNLLPLSNVSNALIVECNEGAGFMKYRSDELGFNNPPGLAKGPIDVAVIGESMALGHCVPPSTSAIDLVRAEFPRTANFGVTGSRVLSQLGVFREYVTPLAPPVVVWFVNPNFVFPRAEAEQPILVKYLNDPDFTQDLRHRQPEIDSFVREVLVPANLARDENVRAELESATAFPFARLVKLRDVRRLVEVPPAMRRRRAAPDLSHFERALELMCNSARDWGGTVIVVLLPTYQMSSGQESALARYEAVMQKAADSPAGIVDGVALFAAQTDIDGLYNLGIDNHPSQRGHALLADAINSAIERHAPYELTRNSTSH